MCHCLLAGSVPSNCWAEALLALLLRSSGTEQNSQNHEMPSGNRGEDREGPEASLPGQRPRVATVRRARRQRVSRLRGPATRTEPASSFSVAPFPASPRRGIFWTRSDPAAPSLLQRMRGTTPFRYRERTCARAPGGVRWGPMVRALGFQGMCYRVIGHLRAR